MHNVINTIPRILLGSVFLASGILKGLEFNTTTQSVILYLESFGFAGLIPIAIYLSILLIGIEIFLGILLILRLYPRITYLCSATLSFFFSILTFYVSKWNLFEDCGCFGTSITLNITASFYKNLGLTFLSCILAYHNIKKKKYLTTKHNPSLVKYIFLIVFAFCVHAVMLPTINDNKYYAKGTNTLKIHKNFPVFAVDVPCDSPYLEFQEIIDKRNQNITPIIVGFIKDETKLNPNEILSFKKSLNKLANSTSYPVLILTTNVKNINYHKNEQLATFKIDAALYNNIFDSDYGILILDQGIIAKKIDFNSLSIIFATAKSKFLNGLIFHIGIIRILFLFIFCTVIITAVFHRNIASFFQQINNYLFKKNSGTKKMGKNTTQSLT